MPYHIASPNFDEREEKAIATALRSGWVTQGPEVRAFETELANYVGASHAVAVSNCTTALALSLKALDVQLGDVVITVSNSFIASANAIRHCGAEPFFVDVDQNLAMDATALETALEKNFVRRDASVWLKSPERFAKAWTRVRPECCGQLKAILVVHQIGIPADMKRILAIAKRLELPVIEDAACAIGSEIHFDGRWRKIGNPLGEAVCFSFHPRKILTTGDGGMITTANVELERRCRLWRHHSMSTSDLDRHKQTEIQFEEYVDAGFNYRLTDLQAAMGRVQLSKLADVVEKRRALAAVYISEFSNLAEIQTLKEPEWAVWNWQSFPIYVSHPRLQLPLMKELKNRGIDTRRGIMCAHLEPAYADMWSEYRQDLRRSEYHRDCGIILPLHGKLETEDIKRIANSVHTSLERIE